MFSCFVLFRFLLGKVSILKGFDEQFIVAIVQELTASTYLPGDFIILKNQIGKLLFVYIELQQKSS